MTAMIVVEVMHERLLVSIRIWADTLWYWTRKARFFIDV
jgi:hypothetical protein